jgi:UDP-N-acetylmuramoyl-L-alanyl-D-glutamate--2,6-diaminopimelate ligase
MHARFGNHPGVKLDELFPEGRWLSKRGKPISRFATDPAKCEPGTLYVALMSADGDGHDSAAQAIENGAAAIMVERLLPIAAPQFLVPDTRRAYGKLCNALLAKKRDNLCLIGVTGALGKTSVATLLAAVFRKCRIDSGILTSGAAGLPTWSEGFGDALAESLEAFEKENCTHAVVEIPEAAVAEGGLSGVEFDAMIVTNLLSDHSGTFGSTTAYRKAVSRVLNHVKESGFAVLCADDKGTEVARAMDACPALVHGLSGDTDIRAKFLDRSVGEQTFMIHAGREAAAVTLRIPGDEIVRHCLAVASTCLVLGLKLADIVRGLESVTRIPGFLDRVVCGQPFSVYVDSSKTPEALAASLRAIRSETEGKVICVYGAPGEEMQAARPLLGRAAEMLADVSVITSTNPRGESPLKVAHDIIDGLSKPAGARVIPDRRRAIEWAISQAQPGDAILIAGRGMETRFETEIKDEVLSDHQIAESVLRGEMLEIEEDEPRIIPFPGLRREKASVERPRLFAYGIDFSTN